MLEFDIGPPSPAMLIALSGIGPTGHTDAATLKCRKRMDRRLHNLGAPNVVPLTIAPEVERSRQTAVASLEGFCKRCGRCA